MDDLPQLTALWEAAHFPVDDLKNRFTEFQVADDAGRLIGALGLQISASDGLIHSETFSDFALSEGVRSRFWDRLQGLAQSHGLFRLWTREAAPFWKKDAGFSTPSPEIMNRLPEIFGPRSGAWLALRLKDESADPALIEAQFAMFRESERLKREKVLARAKALKMAGTFLAALLFVFAMIVLMAYIRHKRGG